MAPSDVKALPRTALLCIDDDQDVLECEKAFLETFGYTVSDRIQWPRRTGISWPPFV